MNKKLLTSFILITAVLACSASAYDPIGYPAQYWITGTVNDSVDEEPAGAADGKTVTLHTSGDPTDIIATAEVANNEYKINAFETYFIPVGDYQVSIIRQKPADYGAGPATVTITGVGFNIGPTLTLAKGEGPGPEVGGVALSIARDEKDIVISWATDDTPDIYFLTGDGSGQFNNTEGWSKVLDGTSGAIEDGISGFVVDIENKKITHTNQVGNASGIKEVYYKALPAGTSSNNLAEAVAVGKVDVELKGEAATPGKNLISVPFVFTDNSIPNVFGEGADSIWENGDLIQKKSSAGNTYFTVEYKDGKWIDQAGGDQLPFTFDSSFGNWVVVRSDKILTVVGTVTTDNVNVNIWAAPSQNEPGKTLLGMIYPKSFGLETATLIANGAGEGDLVQYKSSPLAEAYITAELMGDAWKDQAGGNVLPSDIATWRLPYSYIYVRKTTSAFTWKRSFP